MRRRAGTITLAAALVAAAGPLRARDGDALAGAVVLCADDERAADDRLARDPPVVSGVLTAVVREWGARELCGRAVR